MIRLEVIEKPKMVRPDGYHRVMEQTTDADGWKHYAYRVRLTNDATGATMETAYKMGTAHTKPPTAADVLYSLLSDASGYENAADVSDFAEEHAITNVRQALETWAAIEKQSRDLRGLLGRDYHGAVFPDDDHEAAAARLAGEETDGGS